jgi:hypothetical protein
MAVDLTGNEYQGSLDALKAAMLGLTNTAEKINKMGNGNSPNYKAMSDELKKFPEFIKDFQKVANELNAAVDQITKNTKKTGEPKKTWAQKIYECLCKEENIKKRSKDAAQQVGEELKKTTSGGGGGGGGGKKRRFRGGEDDDDDDKPLVDVIINGVKAFYKGVEKIRNSAEQAFFGFDEKANLMSKTFGDLFIAESQFNLKIKETAFEVEGITGDLIDMQKEYTNVGKSVEETGFNRTKYLKEYTENFQNGIRDAKQLQVLTKQTLSTERQLGLEAGSLAADFRAMAMSAKLNNAQTGAIGRGMVEVARNTGLTSKSMQEAYNFSKPFVENLKKAATYSSSSATNILEIAANAKKLGVEESITPLLNAATSSVDLITKSSNETKAFLYNAAGAVGKIQQLQLGILTRSKKGIRELATGMEKVLQGFGVRSMEEIENLPDEVKFRLNLQLKGAFGMELGEVTRTIEAFKEAGKGLSTRLDELNNKRNKAITLEQKLAIEEEERRLKTSGTLAVLTGLSEATKGAKDMDKAFSNFTRRLPEFQEDIKALGGEITDSRGAAKFSIEAAVKSLNDGLTKIGEKPLELSQLDIEKALNDKDSFAALMDVLNTGQNKLAIAQKAQTDPALKTSLELEKLNDNLRNDVTAPLLNVLKEQLGMQGFMEASLAFIAAEMTFGLAGLIASKMTPLDDLSKAILGFSPKDWLKGIFYGKDDKSKTKSKNSTSGTPEIKCPEMNLDWKSLGGFLKNAAIGIIGITAFVGMLAAALVALGYIAKGVSKAGIDPIEVAKQVSGIILAGVIILTEAGIAGVLLKKAMDKYGKAIMSLWSVDTLKFVGILTLMAVTLTALSAGLLYVGKAIAESSGMSAQDAIETGIRIGAIITAGTIILGVVGAATFGLVKVIPPFVAAVKALSSVGWLGAGIVAGALVALPIIAAGLLYLSIKLLQFCDTVLKSNPIDTASLQETAKTVAFLMGAFASIAASLAVAAASVIGVAALLKYVQKFKVTMTDVNKAGLLMGTIALGIGGLFASLAGSIAIIAAMDLGGKEGDFAKAEKNLEIMGGVLKQLAPAFFVILGITAALTALQVMQQKVSDETKKVDLMDITKNVGIAVAFMEAILLALPPLIYAVVEVAKKTGGLIGDPKKFTKDMEKFHIMMQEFYKASLMLLPIAAVAAAIGFALEKAQMSLSSAAKTLGKGALVAGLLMIIGLALTHIAATVTRLVGWMTEYEIFTPEGSKVFEAQLKAFSSNIGSIAWNIAAAGIKAGASFGSFVIGAAGFALFGAGFLLVAKPLQSAVRIMMRLTNMFSMLSLEETKALPIKIAELKNTITAVKDAFYSLRKFSFDKKKIDEALNRLQEVVLPLSTMASIISDINIAIYQATNTAAAAAGAEAGKVMLDTMKQIGNLIKEISTSAFPSKSEFQKVIKDMDGIGGLMKKFMASTKKIVEAPMKEKLTKGMLKKAASTYTDISLAMSKFASVVHDYTKSVESLQKINENKSAMDKVTKNDNVEKQVGDMLSFSRRLIETAAKEADEFDAGKQNNAIAVIQNASMVLKAFVTAIEGFQKTLESAEKVATSYGNGFATRANKIKEAGRAADGETDEFIIVMTDIAGQMNKIFNMLEKSIGSNNNLKASNVNALTDKLNLLGMAVETFVQGLDNFGATLQSSFQDTRWFFNFFGQQGVGSWLAQNAGDITHVIQNTFQALDGMFYHFTDLMSRTKWEKQVKNFKEYSDNFKKMTDAVINMGSSFSQLSNAMKNHFAVLIPERGRGGKYDNTKFEKYYNDLGNMITNVGKVIDQMVNKLDENMKYDDAVLDKISKKTTAVEPFIKTLLTISESVAKMAAFMSPDLPSEQEFEASGKKIAGALKGLLSSANVMAQTVEDVDVVADEAALGKLTTVSKFLDPLLSFIKTFAEKSDLVTRANKEAGIVPPTDKIRENAPKLGEAIGSIMGLYKVVMDATGSMPSDSKTEEVSKKLDSIVSVINTVITVIDKLKLAFEKLDDESADAGEIAGKKDKVASLSEAIKGMLGKGGDNPLMDVFKYIKEGLVKPMLRMNLDADDIQEAATMFEGLGKIAVSVSSAITSLGTAFSGVTMGRVSHLDVARKVLSKHKDEIMDVLLAVADFVVPITKLEIDGDDAEDAAKVLTGASQMLQVLGGKQSGPEADFGLIGYMSTRLSQLVEQTAKADGKVDMSMANKASAAINDFSKVWKTMLPALATLIQGTVEFGGSGDDAEDAAKIIVGTEQIIKSLPQLLENLQNNLPTLVKQAEGIAAQAGLGQKLEGKAPAFATLLTQVFDFLREAVIDPVGNLEMNYDIEDVADIMNAALNLSASLGGPLGGISQNLAQVCEKMKEQKNLDCLEPLKKFFLDLGNIAGVVANPQLMAALGSDETVEAIERLPDFLEAVKGIFSVDLSTIDPATLGNVGNVFSSLDKFAQDLLKGNLDSVAKNLSDAARQVSGVDEALRSLVASFSGIAGSMSELGKIGGAGINVNANVNQASTVPGDPTQQAAKAVDLNLGAAAMEAANQAEITKLVASNEAIAANTAQMVVLLANMGQSEGGGGKKKSTGLGTTDPMSYLAKKTLRDSSATNSANFAGGASIPKF